MRQARLRITGRGCRWRGGETLKLPLGDIQRDHLALNLAGTFVDLNERGDVNEAEPTV
jgi:hypothetical protein